MHSSYFVFVARLLALPQQTFWWYFWVGHSKAFENIIKSPTCWRFWNHACMEEICSAPSGNCAVEISPADLGSLKVAFWSVREGSEMKCGVIGIGFLEIVCVMFGNGFQVAFRCGNTSLLWAELQRFLKGARRGAPLCLGQGLGASMCLFIELPFFPFSLSTNIYSIYIIYITISYI